jgi:hypothetical protein
MAVGFHPLSFSLYPFKSGRSSSFLAELPRFENSRNVEMTTSPTLPRFRNSENVVSCPTDSEQLFPTDKSEFMAVLC